MMKECVVLRGEVINIGPWEYNIQPVEVKPAEYDEEGNIIKEAVYEARPTNPLPEGAEIVEIEIVEGPDGGLYPADYVPPKTPEQLRIEQLEQLVADLASLQLGV